MSQICRKCGSQYLRLLTTELLTSKVQSATSSRSLSSKVQNSNLLSTSLLHRAHKLSDQYKNLQSTASGNEDYTAEIAARQKRLSGLKPIHTALEKWLDAQKNVQELQSIVDTSVDHDIQQLAREELDYMQTELIELATTLEAVLIPRHPQSHLPALMEIRSGVGGDEANIFAYDLLRMYERYATSQNWAVKRYSVNKTEAGDGVTEAVISVAGSNAFGRLRGEAGVHRVQRTPSTETKGRTHTSTVSINVLPEIIDDNEEDEFERIDMSEVKLEVMRSRGAGGQHVNRTESAVRLTHVPTGITISMQDNRSQHANRRAAFAVLRSRLSAQRREVAAGEQRGLRRSQVTSSDRSEKIRTYNYAQNRVTDHRCNFSSHNLEGVMEGAEPLDAVLENVTKWLSNEELRYATEEDEADAMMTS